MIGTANEMLLYMSYIDPNFVKICSTQKTLIRFRNRVARNAYSEKQMEEWLLKLGCRQIRPEIIIPAIIVNRQKRVFDELTFSKLYLSDELEQDIKRKLNVTWIRTNGYLTYRAMKILLKEKKAYIQTPRLELPSVWSYEPAYMDDIPENISQTIGRLIGNTLPRKVSHHSHPQNHLDSLGL